MSNKSGFALALMACLAFGTAGCGDDGADANDCGGQCTEGQKCDVASNQCYIPCGILKCNIQEVCDPLTLLCKAPVTCNNCNNACTAEQVCNTTTCACDPKPQDCNNCNNACTAEQVCNTTTCACDPKPQDCNNCNNACTAEQVCNTETCACDPKPQDCNNCNNACTAEQVCNTETCACDPKPQDCNNCNNACTAEQVCNTETCACDPKPQDCNNCNNACTAEQVCNTETCACDPKPKECNNCDGKCNAEQVCNTETCACDPKPKECNNCDGKCNAEQVCNTETCACDPKPGPGKCEFVKTCDADYETWDETKCECVNTNCIGKTWDPEVCYCSITGKLWKYDRETPCEETGNECVENPDNIVPNWSFEEWTGEAPTNWTLVNNTYSQAGSLNKVNKPKSCEYAVQFSNPSVKVARMEGDAIAVPEKTFSGGNMRLKCTVWVYGTGKVNLGYRGLDAEGKAISSETKEDKTTKTLSGSKTYEMLDFTASFGSSVSFQPLIGLRSVDDNTVSGTEIVVDNFECVIEDNLCTGISCKNDWEICDIANHRDENGKFIGLCIPRDGFCDITKDKDGKDKTLGCATTEECDLTTHTCRRADGKCDTHADCTDDAKPVCDTAAHECVAGDPCAKVKCPEWKKCTTATRGRCVLKEGHCDNLFDCTDKSAPACYGADHLCVPEDFAYPVSKKSECPLGDYFDIVNDGVEEMICPVNIVPNGSFEAWEEVDITPKTKAHLPVWWYGMDDDFTVYPGHYASEIPYSALKEYTASAHSGQTSLQVEYTKTKAERFSSLGFDVPAKSYDCVYWVRGKGEVRLHWYGSQGEAPKAMVPGNGGFIQYDTDEWTREKFQIKNTQSDFRLVFYVGRTDSGKDHIQIDDVICTERVY